MKRRLATTATLTAVGIALAAPTASAADVELSARLVGGAAFRNAAGHSEYERDREGRELKVTVTRIARLAGTRVAVFVNGRKLGTMLVSRTGRAHREWESHHGQSVPLVAAGTSIKVRKADGTLVAAGTYRRTEHD